MIRRTRTLTLIAAALLMPLGVMAADAPAPATDAPKATTAKPARKTALGCDETTSSRIRRDKGGKCTPSSAPTRTYTKEDIDTTGQADLSEALKRLDPRFH
jgi:hypothetical protein